MFGYVRPNLADLNPEQQARYRAFYCGLCRALKERHGMPGQLSLTFDLTFLSLFLSSLYEPEETTGEDRCAPHPREKHAYVMNEMTDYAADMTIALAYHKCLDDWRDDHHLPAKVYAEALKKRYAAVKTRWPVQCGAIEQEMAELSALEKRREAAPDAAPNCFGRLMAALMTPKEDYWAPALRRFGLSLGRFIYLCDAACDYDQDLKRGGYNPVVLLGRQPEELRDELLNLLGDASAAFEQLPLVQDVEILRNILYSGIWQGYNEKMHKRAEKNGPVGKGG